MSLADQYQNMAYAMVKRYENYFSNLSYKVQRESLHKNPSQSPITRPLPEGTFAFLDGFDMELFPELNDVDLPAYDLPHTDATTDKCQVTCVGLLVICKFESCADVNYILLLTLK